MPTIIVKKAKMKQNQVAPFPTVLILILISFLIGCAASVETLEPAQSSLATIPPPKSLGEPTLAPQALQVPGLAYPTATPQAENIIDINFENGKLAYRNGMFEEAVSFFSAVITRDSSLAPPYVYRGAALRYLGRYDEALSDLNTALTIIPDYAFAYGHRSAILFSMGNTEEALRDSEEALRLDPTLAMVHHNLGVYYGNSGYYFKELEHLTTALTIDPTRAATWRQRGLVFAYVGMYQECVDDLTQAIDLGARWASNYADRGFCETELGNYQQGISDITVAEEIDYGRAVAYLYVRGKAYFFLGEYNSALTDVNQNIQAVPTNPLLFSNRGLIYIEKGEYTKAYDNFDRALSFEIDPNVSYTHSVSEFLAISHYGKGRALYELGRYSEALDEFTISLTYDFNLETRPRFTNQRILRLRHYYRALTHLMLNEQELALSDFDDFLESESGFYPELVEGTMIELERLDALEP